MVKIFRRMGYVLLLIGLIVGCAATKKGSQGEPPTGNTSRMDESFDPLSLNDEDLDFTAGKSTAPEKINSGEQDEPQNPAAVENKLTKGFRIQILSTKDVEKATTEKQMAADRLRDLDVKLYLEFDSPYYKIRVGNYLTREEAEHSREVIRSLGYGDAWIVPDKVWTNPQ